MKAFEFDHNLIDSYARFSRSFSTIRAPDIAAEVTRQYDDGRFWPDALLSLNPRFLSGPTVDDLVASGDLDEATARIFRIGATPIRFHRHQAQSIAKARAGQSFVVTTGTGSGKSLCFFVPVVDAIVRSRKAGQPRKTRAIIVYPMNALANSQIKEIEKFISQSGLPEELKPVVRRYTGQESQEERQRIADNPPDILLTNFMMAELLLTRQDALDTKVIDNAGGLEFIVLDELHTYRGRQGADVAILVRRLRNRCAPAKAPICIGTSATMASEGSEAGRAKAVADVASRLFGASIGPDAVIDESLQRATDDRLKLEDVRPQLATALGSDLPETLKDEALRRHPLAVWAELAIGLDDGQELKRKKPVPFDDAVEQLAQDSGLDKDTCRIGFERFLTRVSLPETERGGTGSGAFLAFKLHRFISGAGEIFTTLRAARAPMKRVLDQILASMDGKKPAWMGDEDDFILEVAMRAPQEFDRAFDRWRELYNSARTQLMEANSRSEITGLSGTDRRKIKAAQMQASDQIAILEQGKATNGSDFYSYRYLATEGFLPGYNFPRLPLYAFVPGEGKAGSFLQRARFLAISEFGPRSLIYHEGRAYRVMKAKLPPEVRTGDGSELATKDIFICSNCGACHEGEVERCHACNSPMAGEVPVQRTLRIDNVEAAPADRITANDEERVRQGFDIQTVFSWPRKDGRLQVTEADFRCGETSILALQYANSAEISRINKGLKRRKNQTVFGFNIDPRSGYWAKSEDEESDVDVPPDVVRPVRIVPIVRDRKNALLLRFLDPDAYAPETIATVQHALLRGIAVTYQLEEGEILGEPLPARDNRRSILAYEATEGGAGVLNRLVEDPHALGKVAREALSLMHFDKVDDAIAAGDASLLVDRDSDACVRGCYRCLLSYFNQPDHELINRASAEAKQMLIDLARGEIVLAVGSSRRADVDGWDAAFKDAGIPAPDGASVSFADQEMSFAWRTHFVAACSNALSEAAREIADTKGWTLFELPETCAAGVPDALISMFKD